MLHAVLNLPHPFDLVFMQRALIEVLLLSVPAGLLGSWIVLRRLAFFTHGVGTATFPGLVVAGAAGVIPQVAALAAALLYAAGLESLVRGRRVAADAATGLLLVAALAVGVVLASDVVGAGAGIDRLLFGSLLGLGDLDLWLTGAAVVVVLGLDGLLRRSWLVEGFDPGAARRLGLPGASADRLLLIAIAVAVVTALSAVGALLVAALFVIPAATVRLLTSSLRGLRAGSVALAAAQGVLGLLLAYSLDVAPGPVLAVLGAGGFALVATLTAARSTLRPVVTGRARA